MWFAEIVSFENCDMVSNYERSAFNSRIKNTQGRRGTSSCQWRTVIEWKIASVVQSFCCSHSVAI